MSEEPQKKKISIVSGCFNEEGNLRELYNRLAAVWEKMPQYEWELIIADNFSQDHSREILRELASCDKRVKVIFNSNNFGVIRSGYNAMMHATGDAVVIMCSDLQDPPEMIPEFVDHWEEGYCVVCAVKAKSQEAPLMKNIRQWLRMF